MEAYRFLITFLSLVLNPAPKSTSNTYHGLLRQHPAANDADVASADDSAADAGPTAYAPFPLPRSGRLSTTESDATDTGVAPEPTSTSTPSTTTTGRALEPIRKQPANDFAGKERTRPRTAKLPSPRARRPNGPNGKAAKNSKTAHYRPGKNHNFSATRI